VRNATRWAPMSNALSASFSSIAIAFGAVGGPTAPVLLVSHALAASRSQSSRKSSVKPSAPARYASTGARSLPPTALISLRAGPPLPNQLEPQLHVLATSPPECHKVTRIVTPLKRGRGAPLMVALNIRDGCVDKPWLLVDYYLFLYMHEPPFVRPV
jgi:hypothetical protein